MSKKTLFLGVVLVLIAILLSACNTHTERPPDTEYLLAEGHQIYVEFCAECHQIDGQGWSNLFPRLAGNPVVTLHDPEPVIDTVLYGQGSMMSFKDKLNSEQIAAVLTYIRNSWGNQAAAVSPRQVH